MGKASAAPAQECVQNHFRIATGFKLHAVGFQFMAQFMVIEDFAVEDHNHVAIGTDERLVTARQIEDAQAGGAERDQFCGKAALLVWSTVREGLKSRLHHATRQTFANVRIPKDATHGCVAFFGQKK
jgi:hypothetical protein